MDTTMGTARIKTWAANFSLVLAGALWLFAIGIGLIKIYDYEFTPGPQGTLSSQWPTASSIKKPNDMFQFIMVVHPHCPCSRASMGELEKIMAHNQGKVNTYVLFVRPKQFDKTWVMTDLYQQALRIPGVQVIIDDEGRLAELFGATTSGQTFLYDKTGNLIFTGGITESRGHAGDNVGSDTVNALINHRLVSVHKTKFFGCSITGKPKARG